MIAETPQQAARRIVDEVLITWHARHPDPDVRMWAFDTWHTRQDEVRAQRQEAFTAMGRFAGEAWRVLGGFVSAYIDGFRAALQADSDDGRWSLEDLEDDEILYADDGHDSYGSLP